MKTTRNKKAKHFVSLIIFLVIAGAAIGVGSITGLFQDILNGLSEAHINFNTLLSLIIMVSLVIAIEKIVMLALNSLKKSSHRTQTIVTIIQSLLKYAAAIVIICWGLTIVGVNVSTVVASIGILTLIIGFGAESLIEDVITGFFMLFENQYNVGDIVEVSGFRGTVTDIGIRTTSITDPGGNIKIINNSNMKDILNRSDNASRSVCDIQIPYETDIEAFEEQIPEMLSEIYELHKDAMKKQPVYLGVQELGDSGITLRFVVEVDESNIYSVQRILNRELLVFFRRKGVEVPYPQLDLHNK